MYKSGVPYHWISTLPHAFNEISSFLKFELSRLNYVHVCKYPQLLRKLAQNTKSMEKLFIFNMSVCMVFPSPCP